MTSAFRCHDTRPAQVSSPLFGQLIDDWIHLNQLPTTALALRRWGQMEPALAGYQRPADVVDAVDRAPGPVQDTLLAALVRLAQAGHQLAGRVLLQLLLPKLGKMALRTGATSSDNAWSEDRRHIIVAEFWDILASYPVQRRPSKVAANLVLDTLHRVTNPRGRPADTPLDPAQLPQPRRARDDSSTPGELSVDADLVELVGWAVDRQVISAADGRLLCRVYLPHPDQQGSAADHAATALGLTPAAVRQRCSRARRHLVDAVRHDFQLLPQPPSLRLPKHIPDQTDSYPRPPPSGPRRPHKAVRTRAPEVARSRATPDGLARSNQGDLLRCRSPATGTCGS